MNTVAVATFKGRFQAEPLHKRLLEAGIPAEVHDELRLQKLWFVKKDSAGVRLEVPADQFERAYDLLVDWDEREGVLRDAVRCPECGSLRVEYPQFTRNSVIPNFIIGTLATIARVEKEYYCQECHYTWPKEGAKPSRARPHEAPYYFIEGVEQTRASKAP